MCTRTHSRTHFLTQFWGKVGFQLPGDTLWSPAAFWACSPRLKRRLGRDWGMVPWPPDSSPISWVSQPHRGHGGSGEGRVHAAQQAKLAEASTRPPSQEQQMPDGDEAAVLAESEESLPEPLISRRRALIADCTRVKDKGTALTGSELRPPREREKKRPGPGRGWAPEPPGPLGMDMSLAGRGGSSGQEGWGEAGRGLGPPGNGHTGCIPTRVRRPGGREPEEQSCCCPPAGRGLRRCERSGRVCGAQQRGHRGLLPAGAGEARRPMGEDSGWEAERRRALDGGRRHSR